MPMLTAEMASTNTKPSMILPRNRKVGSFSDIDPGRTRFVNFTFEPPSLRNPGQGRNIAGSSPPRCKPKVEWIELVNRECHVLHRTLYYDVPSCHRGSGRGLPVFGRFRPATAARNVLPPHLTAHLAPQSARMACKGKHALRLPSSTSTSRRGSVPAPPVWLRGVTPRLPNRQSRW